MNSVFFLLRWIWETVQRFPKVPTMILALKCFWETSPVLYLDSLYWSVLYLDSLYGTCTVAWRVWQVFVYRENKAPQIVYTLQQSVQIQASDSTDGK